jgi:hypothetical protein
LLATGPKSHPEDVFTNQHPNSKALQLELGALIERARKENFNKLIEAGDFGL